jgi:hypothetical protein
VLEITTHLFSQMLVFGSEGERRNPAARAEPVTADVD